MSSTEDMGTIENRIAKLASHIVQEHWKNKIPLFVIGAGVSKELDVPKSIKSEGCRLGVPGMVDIVDKLHSLYLESEEVNTSDSNADSLQKYFELWKQQVTAGTRVDRAVVGAILGRFQDNGSFKSIWISFNKWLLEQCVDEEHNLGIKNCLPSEAHNRIADLYAKVDALCLTTNFDGLLLKSLNTKYPKDHVFSYYTPEQLTRYFTTLPRESPDEPDYVEIQVRGDIFFVRCDPEWCDIFDKCDMPREAHTFSHYLELDVNPLTCQKDPGRMRKPYVSFPGSSEKDIEIRKMLEVLWQYLAHRISCVITIGLGGWWDPVLVAFLSDLSREMEVPFVDVNISPEESFISKEIVSSSNSFKLSANQFMVLIDDSITRALPNTNRPATVEIRYSREGEGEDKFWDQIMGDWAISDLERDLIRHPLVDITGKFAQLGLKSKWWGIPDKERWQHSRLNHSKGVMQLASFLYKRACDNSGRAERPGEKQFLRIAALLHDIGHLPFSHLIEEVLRELNWKPAGYIESFSHDYHTAERVRKVFADTELEERISQLGYSVEDLIKLIDGRFGIGYMDAIVNGPIDADKIDYVFRDAESTKVFSHFLEPKKFLENIGKEITINSAGLLVLKGISADAAHGVLQQREKLYRDFYLHRAVRLLEKALKFIIITYFVHSYNTLDIPPSVQAELFDDSIQFSDLGAIRISMASQELEELVEKHKTKPDIEMSIVRHMKEVLDLKSIDAKVKKTIDRCFTFVESTKEEQECKSLEQQLRLDLSTTVRTQYRTEKIAYDAKTVSLRFPGAIFITIMPAIEFLKVPASRRSRVRSDGTNVCSQTVLGPDFYSLVEQHISRVSEQNIVNVYKMGEESDFKRAIGLFEELLGRETSMREVE